MFKKVLLIVFFMYILVGSHAQAPKTAISLGSSFNFHFYNDTNIAFAAEKDETTAKKQKSVENSSLVSYILPGMIGIILIFGISGYWLVFRKKQLKKEA